MLRFVLPILCATTLIMPIAATAGEVHDRQVNQQQRILVSVMNYSRFRSGTFETLAQSQPIFILWEIAKNSRH
jgi:hypothetical protein